MLYKEGTIKEFSNFQYVEQLRCTIEHVILSGVRSTKSKNLRNDPTANAMQVHRSFDSLPLAQDDTLVASFDQFQLVELLCSNDTERVRAVTKSNAPCTRCQRPLAAKFQYVK